MSNLLPIAPIPLKSRIINVFGELIKYTVVNLVITFIDGNNDKKIYLRDNDKEYNPTDDFPLDLLSLLMGSLLNVSCTMYMEMQTGGIYNAKNMVQRKN